MRRIPIYFAAFGALLLSACSPAEVVVTAEIEVEDPATGETVTRQLADTEVQLLPYDRDLIFDSLAAAAAEPEPQLPAEVVEAQEQVAQAQRTWRDLESRWNTLRDTLQTLNEALSRYSRGESGYVTLYNDWQDLDAEYGRVERQKDQAFARFDSLSKANIQQTQQFRVRYDEWADEAFAETDAVMLAKQRAAGLDAVVDTTGAQGVVTFEVSPGQYWVHARYEEPYSELYWNEPVEVARGEPVMITLDRSNAEVRPKF